MDPHPLTHGGQIVELRHRSIPNLLAEHGTDTHGRAAARQTLRAELLAAAERATEHAGQSLLCTIGTHAHVVDGGLAGCADDGSRCLCECHDPEPEQVVLVAAGGWCAPLPPLDCGCSMEMLETGVHQPDCRIINRPAGG